MGFFRSKVLPILTVAILIVLSLIMSISFVNARGKLQQTTTNWENHTNELSAAENDLYPYNAKKEDTNDSISISNVSLDILYGVSKDIVTYHGELPHEQIYSSKSNGDELLDQWEGYYADDDTTIDEQGEVTNPSYGATTDPSIEDFWGIGMNNSSVSHINSNKNFGSVYDAENVNASNVISLRLYALENTRDGFGVLIGRIGYFLFKGIASLAVSIVNLVVTAKNIDLDTIMTALNLKSLNDLLTKNFIYDGTALKLSAFTGFCIIMLIFALAAFTVRWVRGAAKTTGIWELIGTIAIGLIIIGTCLTGKIYTLGSSIANFTSQALSTIVESISTDGKGKAFVVNITDNKNDSKVTQLCEMSIINKAFIDLQLCTQFGVSDVSELDMGELGDTTGTIDNNYENASKYLSGKKVVAGSYGNGYRGYSTNFKDEFNGNLGYYFWFADSGAVTKTQGNSTYPITASGAAKNKLSSMITYLQVLYNKAVTDNNTSRQETIKNIILSFADPKTGSGMLIMIAFTAVLIIMTICLLKYTLNVIIGKLEMFISLLGLVLAGPLILTTNKKLVNTGKTIIGMMLVSVIEVTVYSIMFDLILYTTATMLKPNIISILITIAFLLLLLKFNPYIAQHIKLILERTTRAISPTLADGKRAIKNYSRNKFNEKLRDYDNSKKVVGYDENNNPIMETRGGNLTSKIMHQFGNAAFSEASDRKGFFKINSETNELRDRAHEQTSNAKRNAVENDVDNTLREIEEEVNREERVIESEVDRGIDETKEKDISGNDTGEYNREKLSEEENEEADKLALIALELEALKKSEKYKQLLSDQEAIEKYNKDIENDEDKIEMNPESQKELDEIKAKIVEKDNELRNQRNVLNEMIKSRITYNVYASYDIDYDPESGLTMEEYMKQAVRLNVQDEHKDELEQKLKDAIHVTAKDANDTSSRKIGQKGSRVNKDAVAAHAAALLQLDQLQKGQAMSTTKEAKDATSEMVTQVIRRFDGTEAGDTGANSIKVAKENVKETRLGSDARKQAKEELKQAKISRREKIEELEKTDKEALIRTTKEEGAGKIISKATISEQLANAIKHRDDEPKKISSETDGKTTEAESKVKTESKTETKLETETKSETETTTKSTKPTAKTEYESSKKKTTSKHLEEVSSAGSNVFDTIPTVDDMKEAIKPIQPQTKTYNQNKIGDQVDKTNIEKEKSSKTINLKKQQIKVTDIDTQKADTQQADTQQVDAQQVNSQAVDIQRTVDKTTDAQQFVDTSKPVKPTIKMSQTKQSTAKFTQESITKSKQSTQNTQTISQNTEQQNIEQSNTTQADMQQAVKQSVKTVTSQKDTSHKTQDISQQKTKPQNTHNTQQDVQQNIQQNTQQPQVNKQSSQQATKSSQTVKSQSTKQTPQQNNNQTTQPDTQQSNQSKQPIQHNKQQSSVDQNKNVTAQQFAPKQTVNGTQRPVQSQQSAVQKDDTQQTSQSNVASKPRTMQQAMREAAIGKQKPAVSKQNTKDNEVKQDNQSQNIQSNVQQVSDVETRSTTSDEITSKPRTMQQAMRDAAAGKDKVETQSVDTSSMSSLDDLRAYHKEEAQRYVEEHENMISNESKNNNNNNNEDN